MSKPKVSMIVSNFNGLQLNLIKNCINSLIKSNYPNWELIVVDNSSTDSSVEYLKKKFKNHNNCFVVQNPINMYSQGLNIGAKIASGKYLAYFNNDVAITKTYLYNLVKEFEEDKKLAIAQGKLLNYQHHKKIDSAGESMDIFGNPVTIGFGEIDLEQYNNSQDILSASGSACMIKRDIFEKIGGYDSIFGIGYEDMDLALRARRFGYKVKRIPNAIIYHKRAATDFADFIKVKVKWHFNKNRLITMIKNYPVSLLLQTLPTTIVIYFGISLYESIIRRNPQIGWLRIASLLWCILNLPTILLSRFSINKMGAEFLGPNELNLFSSKTLFTIFRNFISQK